MLRTPYKALKKTSSGSSPGCSLNCAYGSGIYQGYSEPIHIALGSGKLLLTLLAPGKQDSLFLLLKAWLAVLTARTSSAGMSPVGVEVVMALMAMIGSYDV